MTLEQFDKLLKKEAMGKRMTFSERNVLKMERKRLDRLDKKKKK